MPITLPVPRGRSNTNPYRSCRFPPSEVRYLLARFLGDILKHSPRLSAVPFKYSRTIWTKVFLVRLPGNGGMAECIPVEFYFSASQRDP
ncbi:hypothetical protein KM043_011695 [Ampulex compressa]|nr:hypothetical protein KM043_011695 [Ampulex compressa]